MRGLWGWDFQHPSWEWFSPFLNTESALSTFPHFLCCRGKYFICSFSPSSFLSIPPNLLCSREKKGTYLSLSTWPASPLSLSPPPPLVHVSSLTLGRKAVYLPRLLPSSLMPPFTIAVLCDSHDVMGSEVASQTVSAFPHPTRLLPSTPIVRAGAELR